MPRRDSTARDAKIAAAVFGGVAVLGGGGWLLWKYVLGPSKSEPEPLTLSLVPGVSPLGQVGESSGEIVEDFPESPGARGIDARTIRVGPLVKAIPPTMRLLVDVMLIVPEQPPAVPGTSATPCKAIGARMRFDDTLKVRYGPAYQEQIESGCEKLQKKLHADYDVTFPEFRLAKDPKGIFFAYTWIAFGHPQSGKPEHYTAYPHRLRLRWELVDVA